MFVDSTSRTSPPFGFLSPEEVVRDVRHLPSAPRVLPRLKKLLGDGNSSTQEIVTLIRLDPGIVARVLQVANSAYFSKGARCSTVEDAVHRVGYNQLYELVSYAAASDVLVRPLVAYGVEADELWKMSVACAMAADALAGVANQDRDVAYTMALLHGLGMVAIDEWAVVNARKLTLKFTGYPREWSESERVALGFTQAETGSALLKHWGFPPAICEPVRWQYVPRSAPVYPPMACLLHTAKWLRTVVCLPSNAPKPATPDPLILKPLGVTVPILNGVIKDILARLDHANSILDGNDKTKTTCGDPEDSAGRRPSSHPSREVPDQRGASMSAQRASHSDD